MDHLDMHFLNAVCIAKMRHPDLDIRKPGHLATILTRQGNALHALGLGDGLHVGGIGLAGGEIAAPAAVVRRADGVQADVQRQGAKAGVKMAELFMEMIKNL